MLLPNGLPHMPGASPTPPSQENKQGIRAVCITDDYFDGADDWPASFQAVPRVGDWVRSQSGRHLRVNQVTHAIDPNGEPIIEVELGSDRTEVTPMEGGNASL